MSVNGMTCYSCEVVTTHANIAMMCEKCGVTICSWCFLQDATLCKDCIAVKLEDESARLEKEEYEGDE